MKEKDIKIITMKNRLEDRKQNLGEKIINT